jgi:hypothetical protein
MKLAQYIIKDVLKSFIGGVGNGSIEPVLVPQLREGTEMNCLFLITKAKK